MWRLCQSWTVTRHHPTQWKLRSDQKAENYLVAKGALISVQLDTRIDEQTSIAGTLGADAGTVTRDHSQPALFSPGHRALTNTS